MLPQRLKSRMQRLGWNQVDLSAASGVPQFTISRILSGARPNPRMSDVVALATAVGLCVEDLVLTPAATLSRAVAEAIQHSKEADMNHIKLLRLAVEVGAITPYRIAKVSGISNQTVLRTISGETDPRYSHVVRMLDALHEHLGDNPDNKALFEQARRVHAL